MGMTDFREIHQTWGSHQPLLKAVVEVLKPPSAIECGCGDFSTRVLQVIPNLLTVEHDKRWAREIIARYPSTPPRHNWIIHAFSHMVKNPTRTAELGEDDLQAIQNFYYQLAVSVAPFHLLFMDSFTACRVPGVIALAEKTLSIIITHDMEPPGPEVYQWGLLRDTLDGWCSYIHRPETLEGMRQAPWTGLWSREPLDLELLDVVVEWESQELWGVKSSLRECSLDSLLEGKDD